MDDRERSFEKGLARRLRAEASRPACPDAEILAAYHERSLMPEELNSWKSHIASCADCQEILAQLEATENIPFVPQEERGTTEGSKLFDAVLTQAPAAAVAKQGASAIREIRRLPRAAYWRWIAPAGAIAAGLLVWVAVHETRPPAFLHGAKTEIAKNEPESPPPPASAPSAISLEQARKSAETSKAETPRDERNLRTRDQESRLDAQAKKMPAPSVPGGRFEVPRGATRDDTRAVSPPPPPPDNLMARNQPVDSVGGVVAGAAGVAAARAKEKKLDTFADQDGTASYRAGAPSPAPAAPAAKPAQDAQREYGKDAKSAEDKVTPQAQTVQTETSGVVAPVEETRQNPQATNDLTKIQSMSETVEVAPSAQAGPALRLSKGRLSRLIRAPGGKVVWRLGMYGHIEQSADSGISWAPQTSGTTETLFLGSAPSEQVCWVISMSGVILRTTDSGAHWQPVTSPIPQQQLSLIRASDDLHATVWDYSHRHSFQTSDGGATWTQAINR